MNCNRPGNVPVVLFPSPEAVVDCTTPAVEVEAVISSVFVDETCQPGDTRSNVVESTAIVAGSALLLDGTLISRFS